MPDTPDNLTTKAEAGADDTRSSGPSAGGRGYGARAGETIAGNLARGGDGKFTSAGNASATKPKPTTGRRAADLQRKPAPKSRAAKPRKGADPAKAAEREKRRRDAEARRQQREADRKKREAERNQAKLDRAVEGEKKRREQLAKREQAADARAKREAERTKRRLQRELDKRKRNAQPPKGGGGGGGAKKPKPAPGTDDAKQQAERTANRAKVGQALGRDLEPLTGLAEGDQPDAQTGTALVAAGLATRQRDGTYATTASGRSLLRAAERGDERQARAFVQRAQELQARQAERDRRRQPAPAAPRPSNVLGNWGQKDAGSFAVYKDASGQARWVAVSSTAFQDKDDEIVSVAALKADVLRSDAAGQHGPLRFWHVPGWDIGDCDFRAVHGRSLIESGTFRDPAYAAAVRPGDQVSIGFLHPPDQPDVQGVFSTIYTFERSITPPGRAANPFTRIAVKEEPMLSDEKRKEFESRLGPAVVASILGETEEREKSADALGVRHKGGDMDTKASDPGAMAGAEMMDEAEAMDDMAEAEGDDAGGYFSPEELSEIANAVAPVVAQTVMASLMPALDMEAKMAKWADEVKSAVAGQYAAKDAADAERQQQIAALQAELAQLKAAQAAAETTIKELAGDLPAAAKGGYRASVDGPPPATPATAAHKQQGPTPDPELSAFFSFGAFGQ